MSMNRRLFSILAALVLGASVAQAQTPAPTVGDALELYGTSLSGARNQAASLLGSLGSLDNQVQEIQTALQGGHLTATQRAQIADEIGLVNQQIEAHTTQLAKLAIWFAQVAPNMQSDLGRLSATQCSAQFASICQNLRQNASSLAPTWIGVAGQAGNLLQALPTNPAEAASKISQLSQGLGQLQQLVQNAGQMTSTSAAGAKIMAHAMKNLGPLGLAQRAGR